MQNYLLRLNFLDLTKIYALHMSAVCLAASTDTERFIGDAAENQVARHRENIAFDAKRLIGSKEMR